jgi:archaellum component FlaC
VATRESLERLERRLESLEGDLKELHTGQAETRTAIGVVGSEVREVKLELESIKGRVERVSLKARTARKAVEDMGEQSKIHYVKELEAQLAEWQEQEAERIEREEREATEARRQAAERRTLVVRWVSIGVSFMVAVVTILAALVWWAMQHVRIVEHRVPPPAVAWIGE